MKDEKVTQKVNKEKSSVSSGRVMDFVAKIFCLIAAFVIWFYAMSTDTITLERDFTVPIKFENENVLFEKTGWSVLSGRNSQIVVTLKGKKNIVNQINESDILAFVDLSQVENAGRQTLDIKISAPTECEIVNTSVSSISPYIDKKVTKNVPVKVEYSDYLVSAEYQLDDPIVSVDEIAVTGPESELRTVAAAKAELSLGNITQTISSATHLTLVDEEGNAIDSPYLTISTKTVNITVKLFTTKKVPLTVDYKYGYFNSKNVKVSITPSVITLKGEPSVLNGIESINIATLDEKKYITNSTQSVSIDIPEGTVSVNAENTAVINVEHIGTSTKLVVVKNISFINAAGLVCELQTESLNVTLRGPYNLLSKIKEENISVIADMKNGSSVGVTVVPVTIEIDSEFADSVYEVDSYSVTVNITKQYG